MEIEKHYLAEGVGLLALQGRLNLASAPMVAEAVEDLICQHRPRIIIDLSQVPSIDSSGLGALLAGMKRARHAGGELRIAGANQRLLTYLRLTNLRRLLTPHQTVEQARHGW